MGKVLRVYIDPQSFDTKEEKLVPIAYPWAEELGVALCNKGKKISNELSSCFERTSLEMCDLVLFPIWWRHNVQYEGARELAEKAKCLGKRVVFFYNNDDTEPLPIENSVVFRTSLIRSRRLRNEFPMPAFPDGYDYTDTVIKGVPAPLAKRTTPVVGFCGNIDNYALVKNPIKGLFKRLGYAILARPKWDRVLRFFNIYITKHEGRRIRTQAINILSKSKAIKRNFLIRPLFFNGVIDDGSNQDRHLRIQSRRQFCQNIIDSDYTLSPRGGGNFSYRFYEVLSLGRIPIFINTDCLLPYEGYINWRRYCIWVDVGEIEKLAEKIYLFHQDLSSPAFVDLQKSCRLLWEEWLSPVGFFKNIYRYFEV